MKEEFRIYPIDEAKEINRRIDAIKELNVVRSKTEHVLSRNLPANNVTDEQINKYRNLLGDYLVIGHQKGRFDFRDGDPNVGWKVHLNVSPENIKFVSNYLRSNGYEHKYLHGGWPSDGKIFTIYIGSYNLTTECAEKISNDLRGQLSKPTNTSEIELAEGIVGRFVALGKTFDNYGSSGLVWLKSDIEKYAEDLKREPTSRRRRMIIATMEENAFHALRKKYGDYFLPNQL